MKKLLLLLMLFSMGAFASFGQINKGGLPLSMINNEQALQNQQITGIVYQAPDLETVLKNDAAAQIVNPKPDRCGIGVVTDFAFPASGKFSRLSDGSTVWRAQITIQNAPAIGLYYDAFHMPEGVNYYVTNQNKNQVLGAYTSENNSSDGFFSTQMLQGGIANLEIDIPEGTDLTTIQLHINNVAYFYKGYNYLSEYSDQTDDGVSQKPTTDQWQGGSAPCHVNAICSTVATFVPSRKATARIINHDNNSNFYYFCSATLLNNTNQDCTPYMLTATHCDEDNSTVNSHFNTWIFYFNFEAPICSGGGNATNTNTMVGADFVARADYDSSVSTIIGDFLLLKLRSKIPDNYGAYLAGWNRSISLSATDTFIGFHHPSGDIKKLSIGKGISATGSFNQNPITIPNTHWQISFFTGGVEGGSSGSALFDKAGLVVGDLSGSPPATCTGDTRPDGKFSTALVDYSKFNRNWEYPEGNGLATKQLKPWLDPAGTNQTTLSSKLFTAACTNSTTSIKTANNELVNAVSIYPNPVSTGIVRMKVNLAKQADLNVTFYDITGARKAVYNLSKVSTGEFTFDIGGFANGTYLMRISTDDATISKKVMLVH